MACDVARHEPYRACMELYWPKHWPTQSKMSKYWRIKNCYLTGVATVPPKNGLGVSCEAWRGVLQNFTINAVDILVIDFYASIFWHFGLRWSMFRPIKFHTCSIGFMSGDIAGHGIVWTASCCKKMLFNSGSMWPSVVVHGHWPVSQRMIVEMGDYAWSENIVTVFLACQITIKNVQDQLTVKGKTTRRLIKRPQLTLRHRHARFYWSHYHLG
jgi:hypothetical protein